MITELAPLGAAIGGACISQRGTRSPAPTSRRPAVAVSLFVIRDAITVDVMRRLGCAM